jgi:hypothetical protein
MVEPPTRHEMAEDERKARLILSKSTDTDVRYVCKRFIHWVGVADRYADSFYPCFDLLEAEVRQHRSSFSLENDGIWRLRSSEGKIVLTGTSLKDLFVNVVLWKGEWPQEELLQECADAEDEILEEALRESTKKKATKSV